MINGLQKICLLAVITLLATGCKSNTTTSSGGSSEPSSSSFNPNQPLSFVPEVGEVRKLFDHGVDGESNFYNYCPSVFIENKHQYVKR